MVVIDVTPWTTAPQNADRINVRRRSDGKYECTGSVARGNAILLNPDICSSADDARNCGLAWAEANGSNVVYLRMPET